MSFLCLYTRSQSISHCICLINPLYLLLAGTHSKLPKFTCRYPEFPQALISFHPSALFFTDLQKVPFESLAGYSPSIFYLRWNIFEVSCDERCQDDTLKDVYSMCKHRSHMIKWL